MFQNAIKHPFSESLIAVRISYYQVRQPGENRVVGSHSSKADLLMIGEERKAELAATKQPAEQDEKKIKRRQTTDGESANGSPHDNPAIPKVRAERVRRNPQGICQ